MQTKPSRVFKFIIPVVLTALYFLSDSLRTEIKRLIFLFSMMDVSAIKGYILSFGIWAPATSFFLMVFQSVIAPLPAFLITFANAALFGWIKGAALSWSSALAGAAICFYIARLYGRNVAGRLTSRYALENIDDFFEKHGKYAVLIARLLPMVSFDVVSYAAGLTSMGFWEFFIATGIGQLPATLVYSYVGDMLSGSVKTFVYGLLLIFAFTVAVFMFKKMRQEKQQAL